MPHPNAIIFSVVMAEMAEGYFQEKLRKTVAPSTATKIPKARRTAEPMRILFSLAVSQSIQSRSRHGEIVNQMPAITKT